MTSTTHDTTDTSTTDFTERLAAVGLRIQQPGDVPIFTPEPKPTMVPMHWKWSQLSGLIDELSEHLSLAPGSGRRTLKLTNPGLEFGTTPTFWASIQYILPGEVATAHRHTPEAFRFVMSGHGCRTTVNGENYEMHAGDLVLTPSWDWHDHVHHGEEPMIWLDVLDISLVRFFDSIFFENYSADVQPVDEVPDAGYRRFGSGLLRPVGAVATGNDNPLLAYPKAQADAAVAQAAGLPADPVDDVILEYQDPTTGNPVMKTLSMKTQLLRNGFRGRSVQHTGSKVYWVIDGSGTTEVAGRRFEWSKGDFFAIPSWAPHRHENASGADARLFRVDDSPLLRAAGLYVERPVQDETISR
ncbi:cupin domain-containing protein [Actinacidiphila sp. ITFR-21]|uniref:cupin domain-containing protein n=1 Tax=Actinacidiphila sp. ITFR-21 TaxID=3075199 RepID=UPI00288B8A9A|nr:cupin domain-containing protein [Streptomyces sp. ITFR-21]WNI18754.1 cupin domain-containing protein [Streptomyces sp. ITFR-21]